jgi:hypothetical protein
MTVQKVQRRYYKVSLQLYKDHLIVAFALFDPANNLWSPLIDISWSDGHSRKSHSLRPADRFAIEQEAQEFALTLARSWVDGMQQRRE